MHQVSTLKCGSGCAYVRSAMSKQGEVWYHTAHFREYREITRGRQKGWFEVFVPNGYQLRKVKVPPDAIVYLPRPDAKPVTPGQMKRLANRFKKRRIKKGR